MKLLLFMVRYSPMTIFLAVLTGIVSGAASAVLVALVNQRLAGLDSPAEGLAWLFVGTIAAVLVANLSSRLLLLRLATQAVKEMRLNLCDQILKAPLRDVEIHTRSKLMAALTEDILAVSDTLAEVPLLLINAAIITACFSYLAWLSWPLMLIILAIFVAGVVVHELITAKTRPPLAQGRDKWDELVYYYQALIEGNKELKLNSKRRSSFVNERLIPTAEAMQDLSHRWHKIFAIAAAYGQVFYFAVYGTILFLIPMFTNESAEVLTGFVLMTVFMNSPIAFIVNFMPSFQRASVSLKKIESLGLSLSATSTSDVQDDDVQSVDTFKSLSIRDLAYHYRAENEEIEFSLGPISVDFQAGELVFIIGGNGSGKSSFARILAGLYTQDSGQIRLNGEEVTDANRDAYRQNFAVVFSDYFLFRVLHGLVDKGLAQKVAMYLRELQLDDKVKLEGDQFSTVELSQGQRKRLALLVSFLEDRNVYLFDEWAADQDPVFRGVFYSEILPDLKSRGKTVIVISHDNHYFDVADRIVRFEDGVIVEDRSLSPSSSTASGGRDSRRERRAAAQTHVEIGQIAEQPC
ncbi:MAG: cyclic peptide export ABC transporter [Pseudomonadota bacterium]